MKRSLEGRAFIVLSLVFVVFMCTFFARNAHAEVACSVKPFNVQIHQGETASTTVTFHLDDATDAFDARIGNLPDAVEGGLKTTKFDRKNIDKNVDIVLRAKSLAQKGSFMVPVLYRIGNEDQAVCQFNLIITKGDGKVSTSSQAFGQEIVESVTNRNVFQRLWMKLIEFFSRT